MRVVIGFLLGLLCVPGVLGYANDGDLGGPHRRINELALDRLIRDVAPLDPILQWYRFDPIKLGHQLDVAGTAVVKSGQFYPQDVAKTVVWVRAGVTAIAEGTREESFRWWLTEGGYSADEPEVFQAVRHFYDPTRSGVMTTGQQTERVAFLSDMATGKLGFINPRMDLKTWALTASPYSLATATRAFDLGSLLWVTERERQAEYLARTWRSLGEAMHLLADLTVPAHVRNDAHPPVAGLDQFFPDWSADPYETHVTAAVVNAQADQPAPAEILAEVAQAATPDALLEAVARYTNRSFFSRDTVSGTDGKTGTPVKNANGQPAYASPKLDQYRYEQLKESGRWFYRDPDANVMIAERTEEALQSGILVRHELDRSLAWQARQLIPLAIAADTRLLHLTLPRVRVAIDSLDAKRQVLRCQAALWRRNGAADRPVRLVLPTHQQHLLVFVRLGTQETKDWAALGQVRGNGFDLDLSALAKSDLFAILAGAKPAPAGGVTLQVGLDLGGILVLSPLFKPALPAPPPQPPAPTRPEPARPEPPVQRVSGDPVTPRQALEAAVFPEHPQPGDTRYGYVYNPTVDRPDPSLGHPPTGWARCLEQGTVRWQRDNNNNQIRDTSFPEGALNDQQGEQPWSAWYTATIGYDSSYALSRLDEQPDADGVWPTPRTVLGRRAESSGPLALKPLPNLGDAAVGEDFEGVWKGPADQYPTDYHLTVARGPLVLDVAVSLRLAGMLGYGRFRRQSGGYKVRGDGDLVSGLMDWVDWPGGAGYMVAKANRWRAELPNAAADLARQALATWDEWYLRRVGPSVGLKGLYPEDTAPFWIPPAALPGLRLRPGDDPPQRGDSACDAWYDLPNPAWTGPASKVLPQTFASVAYQVAVLTYDTNGRKSADEVLADTKQRMAGEVAQLKRPTVIDLPGADEAVEMHWRQGENCHRLIFRRANVCGVVWGSDRRAKTAGPVALVRDVARLLLRRIQGDTAGGLRPAEPLAALRSLRLAQLALRDVNLTTKAGRDPVRTEQLGPTAAEQITKAVWTGTTLTLAWQSANLDTGYAVTGQLTAELSADATKLRRLTVTETRTEGAGTPEAIRRTWQATATGDWAVATADDRLTATVPKVTLTVTEERGGQVQAKRTGSGAGELRVSE